MKRMRGLKVNGRRGGFTLIEMLTVIAIILVVAALALPNFWEMIRQQRWNAASSAFQIALMRCRSWAISERRDHSVELCISPDDNEQQYLRIEVESSLLESIAELNSYFKDQCNYYYMRLPVDWLGAFVAGGGTVQNYAAHPWGQYPDMRFVYSGPVVVGPGATAPAPGWRTASGGDWRINEQIRDNLLVDDEIFLPHGILVNYAKSTNLMNFDAPPTTENCLPQYGWDYTKDLRFDQRGTLVQAKNPEIVLEDRAGEMIQFQVLRSTGRIRKVGGVAP